MSAYTEDLNIMFNDSSSNKAYQVDRLLKDYTGNKTAFSTNLPTEDYYVAFKTPTYATEDIVTITGERLTDLLAYFRATGGGIFQEKDDFLATNDTARVTPNTQPAACRVTSTVQTPARDYDAEMELNAVEGDPDMFDFNISIKTVKTASEVTQTKQRIIQKLHSNLSQMSGSSYATFAQDLQKGGHAVFDNYLSVVNTSISFMMFSAGREFFNARPKTITVTDPVTKKVYEDIDAIRVNALSSLKTVPQVKLDIILNGLRETCRKSLEKILVGLNTSETKNFMAAFGNRNTMINGTYRQYYYTLRSVMNELFTLPENTIAESDRKITSYMKKILVDFYIKLCYPLIHFDALDILMKKYSSLGDFINARYAMLAKVLFTYNLVDALVSGVDNVPETVSTQLTTNIYNYIVRNNKGVLGATGSRQDVMKNIVVQVHNMSNDVYTKSTLNNALSNSISANQLSLRSMIVTNQVGAKEMNKSKIVFFITIALLLSVIAVCGVLMFLQMTDVAVMTAGAIAAGVVLYKMISMIISFLGKN